MGQLSGPRWLRGAAQDLRFGAKLLAKERGFAAAALLTLALCIGANAAIFSIVHSVLLRPVPFPEPERLVRIHNSYPGVGVPLAGDAIPDYYDRLRETTAFSGLALFQPAGLTVGEPGSTEHMSAMQVTPSYFHVLGVPALRGRTFVAQEGEPGNDHEVVLTYGLWKEHFGGRADAVGGELRVEGQPYTIVGVMPPGFLVGDGSARLFIPAAFTAEEKSDAHRHNNNWQMVGRLAPGATMRLAQVQIDALNRRNFDRFPQYRDLLEKTGFHTVIVDYKQDLVGDVRGTLYLLQGGVLLVLLIGCVNIANLFLVRSSARARELATRAALGAPRSRLTRQLLTESVMLGVAGGALGVGLGYGLLRTLERLGADQLPRGTEIHMDATVLAVALVASVLAGLAFGSVPAFQLLRAQLSSVLREEGRSGTAARGALRVRGALVVTQIALAFALLVGAGLLVSSFARTLRTDPGFSPDGVLTAHVSLPPTRYADEAARTAFVRRALTDIRAIPGVRSAGVVSMLPFGEDQSDGVVTAEGHTLQPGEMPVDAGQTDASPGYVEALGIQVVEGRAFRDGDAAGAPQVALVDQWVAQRLWPGEDPIGKRLFEGAYGVMPDSAIHYRTVVGVVRNIHLVSLGPDDMQGNVYLPNAQDAPGDFYFAVRTGNDPTSVVGALRAKVADIDPDLPVHDIRTMDERIGASLVTARARAVLLAGFGGLALLLAAIGIYGVLAYAVAQRTAEFGVRLALGSTAEGIFGLVLRHGLRLLGIGLAIGIAGSVAVTRLLRGMLVGVVHIDPLAFAAALALLAAAALGACLIPARRATRVDAAVAMRGGG